MRVGEAIALERDDVDLDGRRDHDPRTDGQARARPAGPAAPHHRSQALERYLQHASTAVPAAAHRARSFSPASGPPGIAAQVAASAARDHDRARPADRDRAPAHARSAPQLRRAHADRLAALGHLGRRADRGAVDLPRARQPGGDLLVSDRHAGADGHSPPSGSTDASERGHDRARARDAGLLHRPADRPATARARTRSPPTATRSGCCSRFADQRDRHAAQRAGHRRSRRAADRRVPRPPRDTIAATRPRPATTGSRRSTRCSPTSRCTTPSTPTRSSACSRSRTSGPNATSLTYLTEPEVDALLAACDQTTWTGRRDHAMLALTIQTGLRISELIALDLPGHHARHRRQRAHDRQRTKSRDERH